MEQKTATKVLIGEKLSKWKGKKGYLKTSVTLLELSKTLGINRTYLSNYVNEKYHHNFNGWVNRLRIKEAMKLMSGHKAMSLSTVAEKVGFTDLAHFSKQFKLIEGMSPSQWKKTNVPPLSKKK